MFKDDYTQEYAMKNMAEYERKNTEILKSD
jgi:hypothetical protein